MLQSCLGKEDAAGFPDAASWAERAGPYLLQVGPEANGQQLTVPEVPVKRSQGRP